MIIFVYYMSFDKKDGIGSLVNYDDNVYAVIANSWR